MQAMLSWLRPKTLKALRGFLGLTGYYCKFVASYGLIARPLTQFLRKDNFHWNQEADKAFNILRAAMTQVPALALPDFSKPFIIKADASGQGVGVVLMQGESPIAFFSQAFSERAQLKPVYKKNSCHRSGSTKMATLFVGTKIPSSHRPKQLEVSSGTTFG